MVERLQGNLLAVGLPCIDSEILPRRNRAFSRSARLLECVAFQTHHQTQVSSVEQPWLDLNQIEAGIVKAELKDCRIGPLLDRLRDEFTYHAQAKGLGLRTVPCSAMIRTDPRLLEQMLRNLVTNALKYTDQGRVLVGCRRHGSTLGIEVWDTGIGIPDGELQAVFDEYHQIGNDARERERGLGLGLSIVQRLSDLLSHRVTVRSRPGKGSAFIIEVPRVPDSLLPAQRQLSPPPTEMVKMVAQSDVGRTGHILVVDDDSDLPGRERWTRWRMGRSGLIW
jgi:two-component system CheB/CheR fusion protein